MQRNVRQIKMARAARTAKRRHGMMGWVSAWGAAERSPLNVSGQVHFGPRHDW